MVVKLVEIFGLNVGMLIVGVFVDVVIFDIIKICMIDKEDFLLKGENIFFIGWKVKGEI